MEDTRGTVVIGFLESYLTWMHPVFFRRELSTTVLIYSLLFRSVTDHFARPLCLLILLTQQDPMQSPIDNGYDIM